MDKFVYDIFHTIEVPTFVLSNVYHHHIGVINNIDLDSIDIKFNMATAQEVSCDVYKELNGSKCDLWDKIVGLRYVFIPEFKEYYKIDSSLDETNEIVKHLTLTSAGEYELSNKKILSLEINTESDILQDDYITTVFYDENNPRGSLLNRALADKAPDWSIGHVDETLKTIQRTFSVNNQSIYDFLTNTVAKEINCLFLFNSVKREISAYDLLNKCTDCGYRGEMLTTCTKCGSTNLIKGYGKDSNIFISADNYAEKITVDGNEDAVKNCFRVTGGDDYMNATIRNCNPNGSHYIYNFSEADYEDMPPQLTTKLIEYGEKYDELLPEYQEVVADYYDNLNSYYFYKTSMMPRINGTHWEAEKGYDVGDEVYVKTLPSWCYLECIQSGISGTTEFDATRVTVDQEFTDGTVIWQAKKNIISVPSAEQSLNDIKDYFAQNDVYFQNNIPKAITEVNNEVKNIAGLTINSIFRIEIILDDYNKVSDGVWTGNIKVYNTGNTEDTITTDEPLRVNVRIAESLPDYMQYMSDKVEKRLNKVDTTFTELFKIEIPRDENYNYIAEDDTQFKEALHEYGLDVLSSFSKSYQGCIETLISNGITDEESSLLAYNLYNPMYVPYYARLGYISDEMAVRQATVDEYEAAYKDAYNKMQEYHKELDMKTFLGDELYKTLYNYIREDEYSNNNYISDGLSDGEVINDAKKLLEIANDELVKANTMQYTLSDTLVNLFNTKEFKDYKDSFRIGDYIICEADEKLYRLRLIGVSYGYSSPDKINLTFSNFVALENYFSDAQNILSTAKTMSTSYGAVMHQVDKSADVTDEVSNWKDEGLSSATTTIKNNDNEEVIIDENGILAREYDDVTQTYSDEQMRITHNIIAFTDNAWETSTLGIGKQAFIYYNNDPTKGEIGWTEDVGYGINAKFVNSGYINGSQITAGDIYSENYDKGHDGSYINLNDGSFDLAGGGLIGYKDTETGKYELTYKGAIEGRIDVGVGSHLGTWVVYQDGLYSGASTLKPDNIYVTGNVRASDFQMGNTLLSSILDKKQEKLNAGANITLTPEQDGTVTISATGGGHGDCTCHYGVGAPAETLGINGDIYVEMSPDESGCTDSITYNRSSNLSSITNSYSDGFHKIEGSWWTDRYEHSYTTYRIDGLTAGETYDVILKVKVKNLVQEYESSSELFGIAIQNGGSFTTLSEHVKDGKFAYYEDGNDKIYFQSLKPMTTKVQSYSFKITAFSTTYLLISPDSIVNDSTIPMDIEIAISDGTIGNYIEDVYYKVEGEWLLYDNDTKYVAGDNITITEVDGENVISATDTDAIGDLTDVGLDNLSNGQVLKYNSTTQKWENDNESGGTTVVANPSGTATASLSKLQVGNDIYSVSGGGGGGSSYVEEEIYRKQGGSSTFSNITLTKSVLDYDMIIAYSDWDFSGNYWSMPSGTVFTKNWLQEKASASDERDKKIVVTFDDSSTYASYIVSSDGKTLTASARNGSCEIRVLVGIKFGGGSDIEPNPQDTPTDTLNTIGIDGTVYDIAGSGGGNALILDAQIYSLDEQVVGVWTDGKPLYQKTYVINSPSSSPLSIDTISNIDTMVSFMGSYYRLNKWYEIDGRTETSSYNGYGCNWGITSGQVEISFQGYSISEIEKIRITVKYTKTTDTAGSGGYQAYGFTPVIYSTKEREIGVWTDGKPLYQKTFRFNSLTSVSNSWLNTGFTLSNCTIVGEATAFRDDNVAGQTIPIIVSCDIGTNQSLDIMSTRSTSMGVNGFTIQYTKTTDTAGSGSYTTLGVPTVHYTTDEQVIGTWIDGKPLYQKTISFGALPDSTEKSVAHNISNVDNIWISEGYVTTGTKQFSLEHATSPISNAWTSNVDATNVTIETFTDRTNLSAVVTVRYTKTTDV